MLEFMGDGHSQDSGGHGGSQSQEFSFVVGSPLRPYPRGTSSWGGHTLPCGNSLVGGHTLTLDHYHVSIPGNGWTILSVSGHTSTLDRHSCLDPGDQTVSDDGRTPTFVLHFVPHPVVGETISSGRGRTPTLVCHFCPDPNKGQTISSSRIQTPTSVR